MGRQAGGCRNVHHEVTFGASDFTPVLMAGVPPANFVLGNLSVTLDPTVNVSNALTATLDFIDPITFSGPLIFTYSVAGDLLTIGGFSSAGGISVGDDDFLLTITGFTSGSPIATTFGYSQSGIFNAFLAEDRHAYVVATPVATTPLPAALPLFAAALGGLGFVGWRRRKSAAA